jgi:hypothetical protein
MAFGARRPGRRLIGRLSPLVLPVPACHNGGMEHEDLQYKITMDDGPDTVILARLADLDLGAAAYMAHDLRRKLPSLFDRFLGTTTSSDFSPTCMLGVRLLPSRAGTRPGASETSRFRAKNFSTCARSPTVRDSPIQAYTRWEILPSRQQNAIGTSELDPFRSSILGPWSPL